MKQFEGCRFVQNNLRGVLYFLLYSPSWCRFRIASLHGLPGRVENKLHLAWRCSP